jgi:hypothetical protein
MIVRTKDSGATSGGISLFHVVNIVLGLCALACLESRAAEQPHLAQSDENKCQNAARQFLGERAVVLKCGFINDPAVLESIAAIRKARKARKAGEKDELIAKLVILRELPEGWVKAFSASKHWENGAGYVGADFVPDDSYPYWGQGVEFDEKRSDGTPGFSMYLRYMATEDDVEEAPVEISWDRSVGRYREWAYGGVPEGFKPELKASPTPAAPR